MLVVDSGLAVQALLAGLTRPGLPDAVLIAPPLLWSEVRSVLHEAAWRGEIGLELAGAAHERLGDLEVEPTAPQRLAAEAWRVADELGWAKTYDAEFVALARLRSCRLVTVDARLRRGAGRLGLVVSPAEL